MSTPGRSEIERLRYWQGQKLLGRDFRDQGAIEAQLRWWHNRALHNNFGVSYGLRVSRIIEGGAFSSVKAECGVAYDCFGRELILQADRRITLPTSALPPESGLILIVRYKEAAQFISRKDTGYACSPCGDSLSLEAPDFIWIPEAEFEVTDGVPLARINHFPSAPLEKMPEGIEHPASLENRISFDAERKRLIFKGILSEEDKQNLLKLTDDPAFNEAAKILIEKPELVPVFDDKYSAQRSRPLARPRIGSGFTVSGETAWEVWSENVFDRGNLISKKDIGVQVTIDTSTAGFTRTPCYFAWLQGPTWDQTNRDFFPVPLAHIDNASNKEFRFRMWMPDLIALLGTRLRKVNNNFSTGFLNFARQKGLHVCWLGIQPCAEIECVSEPAPDCHTMNKD